MAGGACNSNSTVCNKFTQRFSSALTSFVKLQQFWKYYSGPPQGCCDNFGAIEATLGQLLFAGQALAQCTTSKDASLVQQSARNAVACNYRRLRSGPPAANSLAS